MLIYNDIFSWEGFGGKLRLASGQCRLKIFDLSKDKRQGTAPIRPYIVVVSDTPGGDMSVRSCSGHIATQVTQVFNIDPNRMLFIEYNPPAMYGEKKENIIPETYEAVDFTWHEDKALEPVYRKLTAGMLEKIKELNEGAQQ